MPLDMRPTAEIAKVDKPKTDPSTRNIVVRAREILSDPNRWTKHKYARDLQDRPVETDAVDAAKFCAVGALDRATFELAGYADFCRGRGHNIGMQVAKEVNSHADLTKVNDYWGRERVLDAFDTWLAKNPE